MRPIGDNGTLSVESPEDRFSHDMAHSNLFMIIMSILKICLPHQCSTCWIFHIEKKL